MAIHSLTLLACGLALSQGPLTNTLVSDINLELEGYSAPSSAWFSGGPDYVFFFTYDQAQGHRLLATDGTPAGTVKFTGLTLEANAGGDPGKEPRIAQIPGQPGVALTAGYSAELGAELWRVEAQTGSSTLVKDINPGPASSGPSRLIPFGSQLYFLASDGTSGLELWRSDGTTAGTQLAVDVFPGPGSSHFSLASTGSRLLLQTGIGANRNLVSSDGTPAGTSVIANLPGLQSKNWFQPNAYATFNGRTVFGVESPNLNVHGIWITDGSAQGTRRLLIADRLEWALSSNSGIYLCTYTDGFALHFTNGTALGTVQLSSGSLTPSGWRGAILNEKLIFGADVKAPSGEFSGLELAVSDGTIAGTHLLVDINPGSAKSEPRRFASFQGQTYFFADVPGRGLEPCRTDGTAQGTQWLPEIIPGPVGVGYDLDGWWVAATAVPAVAKQGVVLPLQPAPGLGLFPHKLDAAGAVALTALPVIGTLDSNPQQFTRVGKQLYFTATTPQANPFAGDRRDIYRYEPGSGQPPIRVTGFFPFDPEPQSLVEFRGGVAFTALETPASATWAVYWTNGGPLAKLTGQSLNSPANLMRVVGERLFFVARLSLPDTGREVFFSDGLPLAATLLDLIPGPGSYHPSEAVAFGNRYFFDISGPQGDELASTDGTLAGTQILDLVPGPVGSFAKDLIASESGVYFYAQDSAGFAELIRTDGRPGNTQVLVPGALDQFFSNLTPFQGGVAFQLARGLQWAPHWSDGTVAGTVQLLPFSGLFGGEMLGTDTRLFFLMGSGSNPRLYVSDGSAAGTSIVRGFASQGAIPATDGRWKAIGGNAIAVSATNSLGAELWVTDGTLAGTRQLADSNLGAPSSNPGSFVFPIGTTSESLLRVAGEILFSAKTQTTGIELHAVPVAISGAAAAIPLGKGCGSAALALGASPVPQLGQVLNFEVQAAAPSAPSLLFIDTALNSLGVPGTCQVFLPNPLLLSQFATDPTGAATNSLSLPVVPQWIGLPFYAQLLQVAPGEPLLGQFSLSNALELLIKG
jgi:ELWxxDGT repeat protein